MFLGFMFRDDILEGKISVFNLYTTRYFRNAQILANKDK